MSIVFKAQHPIFGRGKKPLGLSYQQRSPYYWWWEFLRRNRDYADCCAAGGTGALAGLYADFGVVSNDNFKEWWTGHGFRLFAEQAKPVKLFELDTPADWDSCWTKDAVMVVAVPLDIPKRNLQGFFARLLKDRHGGKRGRKALSDADASNARYPLHRNVSIHTLRIQLAVYDAVLAARASPKKITLAQIAKSVGINPKSNKRTEGEVMDAARRRSVLAATVSRHFKDAQRIVANTAKGQFPNSD
ncbi:hypothetical protein [Limnohabitans sp. Rim8]|uniref:hypothetical protein n=1 Tax=Limnohabitans sp. Rim8 TaxID=1100718 RepID=UPI002639D904|nr:hypothetical protein [Limnohabitans sp. Rim8]